MTFTRAAVCLFISVIVTSSAMAACAPDRVDLRGDWGQATYTVELANTPETRARGLMFRESMPRRTGMLFIYDVPQTVAFWMRNTLIPLDMIFLDAQGVVQRVHENAIPLDETHIPGGPDILVVLEVNAGQVSQFGIGPGTEMRHPAFGSEAVWPCPAS